MSRPVTVARISPRARQVLEGRAQQLAQGKHLLAQEEHEDFVGFRLASIPCAVRFSGVERVLLRLGTITWVAGAREGIRGVVFLDHVPYLVAELPSGGPPRSLSVLASQPGLVVRAPVPLVAAVEGPLELLEDRVVGRPTSGTERLPELVEVEASLCGGSLLLSTEWLAKWSAAVSARG